MTNTLLTHQMVARRAAKRLTESMPFIMNCNRNREDDINASVNGYKKGGSLKIAIPPPYKVYSTAVFADGGTIDALVEPYVTLTIANRKHVGLNFTSTERALSIDEYDERFIKPAVSTLCATIEADMIAKAVAQVANVVGTAGTVPNSSKTLQQARAKLQRFLAPADPRYGLISDDLNTELVDASKALFLPNKELSDRFLEGTIGRYGHADWFECVNLPAITNGNDVTGVAVSGASQTGSSLLVSGVSNGSTFKKGQVFTIADVYEVHPLTGQAYTTLRQFVVTADTSATTTTVSLPIYPALNATAPGKTVSALPADTAAITFLGSASTAYRQNLLFQRDAFACAFAPLRVIAGCEGYTFDADGISLRVMTGGDFTNDAENTRIDVLYADPKAVYADHACRITE